MKFFVNSDNISGKSSDNERINKICSALESLGHTATNCGVGSNNHSFPDKHGCTGSDCVWVCVYGGYCAGTMYDQTGYWSNYFQKKLGQAKMVYVFVWKPEGAIRIKAYDRNNLGRAHDDNFSPSFSPIPNIGKYLASKGVSWWEGTTDEIIQQIKNKQITGAGLDGFSGGASGTSTGTGSTTPSTYGDMILDLIKSLDGEVMALQYENKVKICRIPNPCKAKLWATEGLNIVEDSVTVKDYNPETTNKLYVKWTDGLIIVNNPKLIERFGEKEEIIKAVRYETVTTTTSNSTDSNTTTNEDGSTTTTNSDGSSTTTYSDGSSVTTDSSGNATSITGGTNSQAAKSIKMGKNKKIVKASERVKGERYITVISNGKPAGYIHLSKSEASKITEGSAKTKIPVRSSLSKMKKGERYKRVYKNGKLIKLIWVKKSYSGPMHIYL